MTEKIPQFLKPKKITSNNYGQNEIAVSENDVTKVLRTTKNKKAAGPGNIAPELYKYGSSKLIRMIQSMFQRALNGERVPAEWKETYLTSIFKKSDRRVCQNYRGISVISTRLYGKILQNQIEEEIRGKIDEDQAGFTAGRSCIEHIYTVQQLIEKKRAKNRDIHLAFIDLRMAYDLVPRNNLWQAMKEMDISQELIEAVKNLYTDNKILIKAS